MGRPRYAIYTPAERDMPWLAVVLVGGRVSDAFACKSEKEAKRILRDLRPRTDVKVGMENRPAISQA